MSRRKNSNIVKRNRRKNLMKVDPHCWYCGLELVYVEQQGVANSRDIPYNYPTIEHLFSRNSGRLSVNHTNDTRRVLACPECNWNRARWEELLILAGEPVRRYGDGAK